ncbi:MAG: ECF transporter S component [Vallitaleaceae bacterium]|nr:ECF transporter S component [Vallitaleaceae bacterium]
MNGFNVRKDTRLIVVTGMMLAITLILTFTPLGFIQVPPISITIMHLPVIIAGVIAGPISGFIVGLGMGLASMFKAISSVNIADKVFVNPLVSVLPRIFIGVTSYYSYYYVKTLLQKLKSKNLLKNGLATLVGALTGTLTNTILVLTMLYVVHFSKDLKAFDFIKIAVTFNVALELVAAVLICVPVAVLVEKNYR